MSVKTYRWAGREKIARIKIFDLRREQIRERKEIDISLDKIAPERKRDTEDYNEIRQ